MLIEELVANDEGFEEFEYSEADSDFIYRGRIIGIFVGYTEDGNEVWLDQSIR